MKVALGSTNPMKIEVVKAVLEGREIEFRAYPVPSGVRSQPLTEEETRAGAIYRARECLIKSDADIAIGLEAGVFFSGDKVYLCQWGALIDKEHELYVTNAPIIRLPSHYKEELLLGKDLDSLMHEFTGFVHLGCKEGAIDVFTSSHMDRKEILIQMVQILFGQYEYYTPLLSASSVN